MQINIFNNRQSHDEMLNMGYVIKYFLNPLCFHFKKANFLVLLLRYCKVRGF